MSKTYKTLCFGEILWDIFHEDNQQWQVLGGAPSNLCYFLNTLGESAILISHVGKDALGDNALAQLRALNIPHLIPQSDFETGKVDIIIQNNEPQYTFNTPAAWDFIPYSNDIKEVAQQVNMITFGSLTQRHNSDESSFSTLQKILADNPTATRFLDLNLRAPHFEKSNVLALLELADILKINEDEFYYLKSLFALEALSTRDALYQLILMLNLNLIILTLGAEGSIVMSETDYSAKRIQKIDLVDTVGAGDAFSAAFLTALNHGANFSAAHQFANQFSSYICTQKGAFVSIPPSFKAHLNTLSKW